MRNDWIFKMFPYFFVTVFVLIVAYYILLGTVAVKAVSAVEAQANDETLWLLDQTIGEAYVLQSLRWLHRVIEENDGDALKSIIAQSKGEI